MFCLSLHLYPYFEYASREGSGESAHILIDFLHTVKAATLIFISGRGLAISSVKEGISGSIS